MFVGWRFLSKVLCEDCSVSLLYFEVIVDVVYGVCVN